MGTNPSLFTRPCLYSPMFPQTTPQGQQPNALQSAQAGVLCNAHTTAPRPPVGLLLNDVQPNTFASDGLGVELL